MRLGTVQIVAGLLAAVLVVFAFMAAGGALAALVLAGLAVVALGWLGWTLAKRALPRGHGSAGRRSA
jgi:fatty acid desaturase